MDTFEFCLSRIELFSMEFVGPVLRAVSLAFLVSCGLGLLFFHVCYV
jgi:hypothetical protein